MTRKDLFTERKAEKGQALRGRVVRERHFVGGGRIPEKGTRRASRR